MKVSLSVVQNQVFDRLKNMVEDPNFFAGWAETRALALYAQAQMERWMTEGGSQGERWEAVSEPYRSRKLRMFGGGVRLSGKNKGQPYPDYFGSGQKTLIATSRLLASMLPPSFRDGPSSPYGEEFRKIITDKTLEIASAVPYAAFVDDFRSFTAWSDEFKRKLREDFAAYLASNVKRGAN